MRSYFVVGLSPLAVAVTGVSHGPCAGSSKNLPTISCAWVAGCAEAAVVADAAGFGVAATLALGSGAFDALPHADKMAARANATTTRLI
jgi:hypothetical protein